MKTADITIEFACAHEEMVRERIESVHLDRYGIEHEIVSITPGCIPEGQDQCDLPEYRGMHGLGEPASASHWSRKLPEGCTSYVAHLRLRDPGGVDLTRERILTVPFGDRDLGFSIGRIG